MVSQCLSGEGKHYRWMCMASGGVSGYVLQSSQLCGPGKTHFLEREPIVLSYRTSRLLTRFYVRTTTGQPSRYVPEKKKKLPNPKKTNCYFLLTSTIFFGQASKVVYRDMQPRIPKPYRHSCSQHLGRLAGKWVKCHAFNLSRLHICDRPRISAQFLPRCQSWGI